MQKALQIFHCVRALSADQADQHRVVFPAMGSRFCTDDGYVIDQLIDYYKARAAGGCGLNIVEATAVCRPGAVFRMLQISDDSYISGLKKLTEAIHEAGGKACIQLWQGGIAASQTPNSTLVVPSDIPMGEGKVIPGVSKEVIHECVRCFGEAAKRSVEAGFDCVEFHAAHKYSPHHFLSPALNHRTDEYGGSFENRARYPLECIRAIRENIPDDMPIPIRIPAKDDELPTGLTIEDMIEFSKMAQEAGADVLDISRGNLVTKCTDFLFLYFSWLCRQAVSFLEEVLLLRKRHYHDRIFTPLGFMYSCSVCKNQFIQVRNIIKHFSPIVIYRQFPIFCVYI